MNFLFRIKSFLKFIWHAKPLSGNGIHSPFVFYFATNILKNSKLKDAHLPELKRLFKELKPDKRIIKVNGLVSRLGFIPKSKAFPLNYYRLLNAIITEFKPLEIIEFGSSIGVSTAAMAMASPNMTVNTIDENPELASIAGESFKKLGLKNIKQSIGTFDDQLPALLKKIKLPFLAVIYSPSIKYFEMVAAKADSQSIVVIDDIHSSKEIEQAWDEIYKSNKVTVSIDLFRLGIIFFNEGLPKQKFNLLF
jgi:predicted O-methyltransferase YrrM